MSNSINAKCGIATPPSFGQWAVCRPELDFIPMIDKQRIYQEWLMSFACRILGALDAKAAQVERLEASIDYLRDERNGTVTDGRGCKSCG